MAVPGKQGRPSAAVLTALLKSNLGNLLAAPVLEALLKPRLGLVHT